MKKETVKSIIEFVVTIIVAYLLSCLIITYLFKPVTVDGSSMHPTLVDKDYGFASVISRKNKGINRFDICVIDLKEEADKYLVKRVIGLPNEKIKFLDNELYINDVLVEEPFLSDDVFTDDFEIQLKDNEYFCCGDNRPNSSDSRNPKYGPFPAEKIIATGIFIVFPFRDFGFKK